LRGVFTTPDGIALELDRTTYPDCSMALGLYELDVARCIKRMLRPGDHFIDGGANLGYFTLLAAQCVGERGRVDAFEPHPANFARLEANVARNGTPAQVRLHAYALADAPGAVTMHMPPPDQGNHGCASLYGDGATCTAHAVRLDDHLPDASPRLIKLDVEGAEAIALRGAGRLLQAARPTLIIEHNPESAALAGEHWFDALPNARAYHMTAWGKRGRPIGKFTHLPQTNLLVEIE
jgi:FkbM family methyltransferase